MNLLDASVCVFGCRHDGYFVDLFVRVSNAVAINMYTKVPHGGSGTLLSCSACAQLSQVLSSTSCSLLWVQFGYSVYRRVLGYYSNDEDAFGE